MKRLIVKFNKIIKILNLEKFISEKASYDTKLSNSGDGLSTGQKQRINCKGII